MLALWSFELREPKQFLMLLYSVFLFIFLLADFTLEYWLNIVRIARCLFVPARQKIE